MKIPHPLSNTRCKNAVDVTKRRTLKLIGGSAALAGGVASALIPPNVAALESSTGTESITGSGRVDGPVDGHIAISIMTSKSVGYDWILMENLSDHSLEVKSFNPGIIVYLGKQLDLNKLIPANESTGVLQLHSDYAWSESLYDLPDKPFFAPGDEQLQADSVLASVSSDTQVLKCWADVAESQARVFIGDAPNRFS